MFIRAQYVILCSLFLFCWNEMKKRWEVVNYSSANIPRPSSMKMISYWNTVSRWILKVSVGWDGKFHPKLAKELSSKSYHYEGGRCWMICWRCHQNVKIFIRTRVFVYYVLCRELVVFRRKLNCSTNHKYLCSFCSFFLFLLINDSSLLHNMIRPFAVIVTLWLTPSQQEKWWRDDLWGEHMHMFTNTLNIYTLNQKPNLPIQ